MSFDDECVHDFCAQAFFGGPVQVVAGLCVRMYQTTWVQAESYKAWRVKTVVAVLRCAPQYVACLFCVCCFS